MKMKLHARVVGQEGPVLVVLHGLFGMSDNWQSLGKQWSRDFQVHLLDLRNHGRSPHHPDVSYEAMSEDLVEYFEQEQLGEINLLGHSMGGKVAMLTAALHPEYLARLIVADIGPRAYPPHHQFILDALAALPLDELRSRADAEAQFAPELPEGVRLFLLKNLYWREKDRLDWRFNRPALSEQIEKVGAALPAQAYVDLPTLFIRGGASDYISDADWPAILQQFPQAELESIPGAGHWLHAEKPAAFDRVLRRFLGASQTK